MAGRRVYNSIGGSDNNSINNNSIDNNISAMLQSSCVPCRTVLPDHPLDSLFLSGSSSSPSLFGSSSMVSFEDVLGGNKSNKSFFRSFDHDEAGDEEFDEYLYQPEKKRRLSAEQVQFLEKSFELENKLEPERKIQLAKDLGLQPRQVAIWFQNRRARWKTKQLEKDYDALQASYNSLKTDYDTILKEKDKLKAEVLDLTEKLKLKEIDKGRSELSNANKFSREPPQKLNVDTVSESEVSKDSTVLCKQEEISPAKSDTFDSESPHYADHIHSSLLEPGDTSYAFEPDQSDVSQDEDDTLNKNLVPGYIFPKTEDAVNYSDPPTNSCSFVFPIDDQHFWSWSY